LFVFIKNLELVIADCDQAVNLNNKYVKALDRRAKSLRRQAMKIENFEVQVIQYRTQCCGSGIRNKFFSESRIPNPGSNPYFLRA
jgi:hypothetical protein